MKILLIFISTFLLSLSIFAQNIEELTAEQINDYAWKIRKEYPDSTIIYTTLAIEKAKTERNDHQKLRSLNFRGVAYNYKGDYINSLKQHVKAKNLALILNDSLEYAHSLNSIGRLYFTQGQYIKAYEMYFNSLSVFLKIDNLVGAAYCYNSLAELYAAQYNFIKAEEMARKTLAIRKNKNDIKGQISAWIELAKIQKEKESYIESYESYIEAEKLAQINDSKTELAEVKLGIAELYLYQKNSDRGLIYAKSAFELVKDKNNIDLQSQIQAALGKLYFLAGEFDKSETLLLKILELVRKSSDVELKTDALFYLSKIKENQGEVNKAYTYFKLYNDSKQVLDNSNKARMIERLEGKIEIEKRDQENNALKDKQLINQAIIERQIILNIAITVGLILTSTLFIIMYIYTRRKKRDNVILAKKTVQIKIQNESLAEMNAEKDMLMNIVAHDLQSPINNIKSLIGIMTMEGQLNEKQKDFAQKIVEMSNAGEELIQDLLYMNDFESNTHQLKITSFNIDSFIKELAETFMPQTTVKQIALRFDLNCNDFELKTDVTYLKRILENLISNAVKFTNRNKSIYLSTSLSRNNQLILKVKDEGQGFSEKDKKNIYKKFKKLSARPTGGESSNGLGLSIVKILCGRLGIDIELASELEVGSEFTLTFNN